MFASTYHLIDHYWSNGKRPLSIHVFKLMKINLKNQKFRLPVTDIFTNLRAFLLFIYGAQNGSSHIWAPYALRQKRFFYSYMGAIYGGVFPIYAFFSMGNVVSHLPLFSYIGAVSFLNFHFEKKYFRYFCIYLLCLQLLRTLAKLVVENILTSIQNCRPVIGNCK